MIWPKQINFLFVGNITEAAALEGPVASQAGYPRKLLPTTSAAASNEVAYSAQFLNERVKWESQCLNGSRKAFRAT